jgi:type IV pilus assembly protein PilX
MESLAKPAFERGRIVKQRGVVLFFALVSLVAIMLAAVALIRSVDTSTLIAGNLAFREAATTSGDRGTEAAMAWLTATDAANASINVLTDSTHPFNIYHGGNVGATYYSPGYYPSVDPNYCLTSVCPASGTPFNWDDSDSVLVLPDPDSSGNSTRYIIQRMCRNPPYVPSPPPATPIKFADCLFSGALVDTNGQAVPLPQQICQGAGCPSAGQAPEIRITSRTAGPRNTVSYVQAFVY